MLNNDNTIQSVHCPNMVVGIAGSLCGNSVAVVLSRKEDCLDSLSWNQRQDGVIVNAKCNTKAIDISGGSSNNGANLILWSIHGGANQLWELVFATPSIPTSTPTAVPVTLNPTSKPSVVPLTLNPTANPTEMPVTMKPTANPTAAPITVKPTAKPTAEPVTVKPTAKPTTVPVTIPPTQVPSQTPTKMVILMNHFLFCYLSRPYILIMHALFFIYFSASDTTTIKCSNKQAYCYYATDIPTLI